MPSYERLVVAHTAANSDATVDGHSTGRPAAVANARCYVATHRSRRITSAQVPSGLQCSDILRGNVI